MTSRAPTPFGRYELLAEIGRGGMASLHLARLRGRGGFEKLVAIKRILPHLSRDDHFVEMFLNEGKIAARLTHPNVCQVFELGDVDGELFLSMEYLEGVAVDELVAALPVDDTATRMRLTAAVVQQACEGLHYAHGMRDPVVHRDISPHNLFVTTEGVCKVLDFGVSKVLTGADATRSGLIKGKLTYMPPEQLRGEEVDARVDVWAMGVVLWEMLAGRRLFVRDSDYMIMQAIVEGPIPSLRDRYGAEVDEIVARALQRDRTRRTPAIRALADELATAAMAFGGALGGAELASLVRRTCAGTLTERARVVADATEVTRELGLDEVEVAAEPSVTGELALRTRSVGIRPPARSRRRWALPVAGLAIAAVAIGVVAARPSASNHASAPVDAGVLALAVDAAPAAPVDAPPEPVVVAAPSPRPQAKSPAPAPKRRPAVAEDTRPGFFSIDADPYATIFVDGKRFDQTPLFKVSLPSGAHRIRALRADGHVRTFTIKIAPGQHVNVGRLAW